MTMTQIEAARAGITTAQMESVAADEYLDAEQVRQEVAAGRMVIPANTVPSMLVSDILSTGITRPRYSTLDGEVTSSGIVSGTPAYMAPEQHLGRPASPKSDQFGYCVALWEALYFQRPFEGKTAFAVADAIIEGRIVHVPKRTRVPPWVRNILLRGLATNPDHRYESMRSLLASLVFTAKIFGG